MSKVQKRRAAAAKETEKEEEQHELLDGVAEPEVPVHRAEFPQLLVIKEEVEWRSSLDQKDPSEQPHIKEEQEELWTRQEAEQLRGLEEAGVKFTSTPVPVKSEEDDEEGPQSSQLHQIKTEAIRDGERLKTKYDGEDYGGPEPARNVNTGSYLQPADDDKTSHSSEPETDDSWDWEDTRKHHSGLNPLQHNEAPIRDADCNPGAISVIPSECATTSGHRKHRLEDDEIQTGVRPFGCSVCGKRYRWKNSLTDHNRLHAEEKPFSCSECKKAFQWKIHLVRHMRTHSGEKPFSCSVCGEKFAKKQLWRRHLTVHTGEKPFCCSVCGKRFTRMHSLRLHSAVHTRKNI